MNGNLDIYHIVSVLKGVLNKEYEQIPLHEPLFKGNEWVYIKDCLDTGWVSSIGKAEALGCAQIEQIDQFIQNKRVLAEKYRRAFKEVQGVTFFEEPTYARSNYWLNVLLLTKEYAALRDSLLLATHEQRILTRPAWTLMNKLETFESCPSMDLSIAESLEQRIINIPSSACLGGDDSET